VGGVDTIDAGEAASNDAVGSVTAAQNARSPKKRRPETTMLLASRRLSRPLDERPLDERWRPVRRLIVTRWCRTIIGIDTILTVRTSFRY
jgi:hypothetical protein